MPLSFYDFFDESKLKDLFARSVDEDGAHRDITSQLVIPSEMQGIGRIMAKQDLVLAGIEPATRFFVYFDSEIRVEIKIEDGMQMSVGDVAATVEGSMRTLLAIERSSLNLLQYLSGIASLTAQFVERVKGTKARILDTRKTIPGMRGLEKYAVHCGGGQNHRLGLHDAILIKDNHIAAAGGVGKAVLRAKIEGGLDRFVEVEVKDIAQLEQALDAHADRALLDNMTPDQLAGCVERAAGRIELEASGNVTLDNIGRIARTGVDFISIGALTHSAPAVDINMKIEPKS